MGWRDRDYNRGREAAYSFFANPSSALGWSVPFGKFPGFYIRLHFWFLIWAVFEVIGLLQARLPLYYIPATFALLLVILLIHEFGHRILARSVGGNHWEFVLWPLGGMVAPSNPPTAWATFISNFAGILFTIPVAGAAYLALANIPGIAYYLSFSFSPFNPLVVHAGYAGGANQLASLGVFLLGQALEFSAAIIVINLFPCYWFDGGRIWESVLWPSLGRHKATTVTCMLGMILSVPFFLLSIWGRSLLGLVIWALIFADCFNRRRAMITAGPGVLEEESYAYSAMDTGEKPRRKGGWWKKKAAKRAALERSEQAKIDEILAKVHDHGLHSLTWFEKRTLKKATERQRQRELAHRQRERA